MKKSLIIASLIISFVLSSCSSTPSSNSLESANQNYEVEEYYVYKDDNVRIYGNLYIPLDKNDNMPVVILSHSANLTSDSMKSYGKRFADAGYIAYAFDFCGGSNQSRSDGRNDEMTIFSELEDLKAVVNSISSLNFIDRDSIYLFGTSQGGLVSALAADELKEDIAGLMLFYPAFNIADLAKNYADEENNSPFITTLLNYDVYEHIGTYMGDVLILHGSKDFIVPVEYVNRAAELYQNCELYIINGASHGFNRENYAFSDTYDDITWNYVNTYLLERSGH